MALMKCRGCQSKFAVGFMPTATCGLLIIPAFVITLMASFVIWRFVTWWALVLSIPAFFLALLGVHFIPWTCEYLFTFWRRCPRCGQRRWSYPFTEGFGL